LAPRVAVVDLLAITGPIFLLAMRQSRWTVYHVDGVIGRGRPKASATNRRRRKYSWKAWKLVSSYVTVSSRLRSKWNAEVRYVSESGIVIVEPFNNLKISR